MNLLDWHWHSPHPIRDICQACWWDGYAWGACTFFVVFLLFLLLGAVIVRDARKSGS